MLDEPVFLIYDNLNQQIQFHTSDSKESVQRNSECDQAFSGLKLKLMKYRGCVSELLHPKLSKFRTVSLYSANSK